MRAHGDGAGGALVASHGPKLLEGLRAVDGGLLRAGRDVEIVDAAVRGDGAAVRGAAAGVVAAEVFDDVVFDERVAGPAVDGQVGVAVGGVVAFVADVAVAGRGRR